MSDESTQDQDEAPEIEQIAVAEQEPMVAEEAKPGKKSKAVKKKTVAESLPQEKQALEPVADPIAQPAPEPVATPEKAEQTEEPVAEPIAQPAPEPVVTPEKAEQTEEPVAEPIAQPAPEPVATTEKSQQANQDNDLFQQGIQSLLHWEYDAADNFFRQALTAYRKQGDQAGQIDVLEQLGLLCFLRGAEAQTREYYRQAGLMRTA